ncbi:hypothetical protein DL96DRAFT_713194 [Flagelloscypha sp. PMI_526]|nr:hypothetical protein DL96DRAFT_713194 [Flagelloscypha sp. PMI_526]
MCLLHLQTETISGPSNFHISIPFLEKSDHDIFQAALAGNHSTFSTYSIESVQNLLHRLNARKATLASERDILVQSIGKPSIPFPIIPLDLSQYIMEVAASTDTSTASRLSRVSKVVQPWADKYLFENLIVTSQQNALALWTLFDESPTFTARCATWTQCCVFNSGIDQSLIPKNIFITLRNLRSFAYWH